MLDFDIVEYSSGGKERRYGISKCGNSHLRRAAVDAIKFTIRSPTVGTVVLARQKDVDERFQKISSRCSYRLYKKASRMIHSGKPKKKVHVACAREFLGFVWEALREAA